MKLSKVLVSSILFIVLFSSISCKDRISEENESSNIGDIPESLEIKKDFVPESRKKQCSLTKEDAENYDKRLKIIYENSRGKLKNELYGNAKEFSENFYQILKSCYESEFNVNTFYEFKPDSCNVSIHYNTQDEIEEDGEKYNIESSVILIIKLIDGKLVIENIGVAG